MCRPNLIEAGGARVWLGPEVGRDPLFDRHRSARQDSIQALVNLALLTGNLGREGAGLFALTEHNNLQGVCDMGMMPDRLPGYAAVDRSRGARAARGALAGAAAPAHPVCSATSGARDRGQGKGSRRCGSRRYDPVDDGDLRRRGGGVEGTRSRRRAASVQTATAQHAHVILPTVAFGEEQCHLHQHRPPHPARRTRGRSAGHGVPPGRPGVPPGMRQPTRARVAADLMGALGPVELRVRRGGDGRDR